jgi:hypothetical protein
MNLAISNRTMFLDVNGVRSSRGISADKVNELVETGGLLWVFDLGLSKSQKPIRTLRFWAQEIIEPAGVDFLPLGEVIAKILPARREAFSGSEIGQIFMVSRPTVKRLGAALQGKISIKRVLTVEREPLADFLRRRWVGARSAIDGRKAIDE